MCITSGKAQAPPTPAATPAPPPEMPTAPDVALSDTDRQQASLAQGRRSLRIDLASSNGGTGGAAGINVPTAS